jgi:hypothetical protein
MSTGPVPIAFIVPEWHSTIKLDHDILTEIETATAPSTSFICDVNMQASLFRDTFLFSTDDVENWNTDNNLERTMFFVNRSLTPSSDPWWKQYSNSGSMFNLAQSTASNNVLTVSDYTTSAHVDVTEIFCAWYMSKILNGIKDAQVLVNNALEVKNAINTLFKDQVFNLSIDRALWSYNLWGGNGSTYSSIYNVPSPQLPETFPKEDSTYHSMRQAPDNTLIYGVPFVTNNTENTQTLPQRLFEQLGYGDMQRIPTICGANNGNPPNYIKPADVYDAVNNPLSRIPPEILGPSAEVLNNNIYKFPFIAGDSLVFKLNIKVKTDNTLTIFNSANGGNITATINALNASFNAADNEGVNFLSFLVRITLVDPSV